MTNDDLDAVLVRYFDGRKGGKWCWQTVADVQTGFFFEDDEDVHKMTYSRIRAALKRLAKQNKILEIKAPMAKRKRVHQRITQYHHLKYL
jgi:hypothetical protein